MTTKLTLSISEEVVVNAKKAAKKNNTSVSKIVEDYLRKVSKSLNDKSITETIFENAPNVKTIRGTEKTILANKLKQKYGR
jgi:glutamyl-tRNA reductase